MRGCVRVAAVACELTVFLCVSACAVAPFGAATVSCASLSLTARSV